MDTVTASQGSFPGKKDTQACLDSCIISSNVASQTNVSGNCPFLDLLVSTICDGGFQVLVNAMRCWSSIRGKVLWVTCTESEVPAERGPHKYWLNVFRLKEKEKSIIFYLVSSLTPSRAKLDWKGIWSLRRCLAHPTCHTETGAFVLEGKGVSRG